MSMTAQELEAYALARYDQGYDVCYECYSQADWDNLAKMSTADALDQMATDVYIWKLQLSETRFE